MEMISNVNVVEVGPRDGYQNVKTFIPTDKKIEIIDQMIDAGIRQMEITSFVNPKWLPQMADATQVAKWVLEHAPEGFRAIALAPNARGVKDAVEVGIKNVTYVISASETHNQKNVNRDIRKSLEELKDICREYMDITIRVSLAVSFGCPFEGNVPLNRLLHIIERIKEAGVREIVLCDTIGTANPVQVQRTVGQVKAHFSDLNIGLHIHDTRGMGLSNIYAGILEGVQVFETSIGGLGGCPFAPGSAGNTSTEDMLNMLSGMGIEHGVNLEKYLLAAENVKRVVKAPLTGRLVHMCKQNI